MFLPLRRFITYRLSFFRNQLRPGWSLWFCGFWLLIALPSLAQTIRYVRQGGSGNGTSWAAASGDIQKMIDVSGVEQVWVAQGTYKPATGNNPNRSIGFVMKNGVTIYGGFPATGNPSLTERKPTVYTTILSGDIDNDGSLANNSYHVVYNRLNNLDNTAILDGFTVTGGNASDPSPTTGFGGGIYNENSSPQIVNCLIRNNYAVTSGGGMINIRNLAIIINCTFQGNVAGNFGGGMYTLTSNLLVINGFFRGNTAQSGGGLYLNTSTSAQLANCTFASHSTANNFGNAIVTTGNSSTQLLNCIAWNNGGVHTFDGSSSVQATYSLFEPTVINYSGSTNIVTSTLPFTNSAEQTLRPCSPAINAGDPNSSAITGTSPTDAAGNPRLYGDRIDMGAFEYQNLDTPIIIQQPISSTSVQEGTTVTASVSVSGVVAAYQWYRNDNAVSGQTSATLTLPSVKLGDAGSYSVLVKGYCNTAVTSTAFNLIVTQPVRYVRQSSSGLGDGSSWANASSDLQGQINAPGVEQVWVAAGTYKPTAGTDRTVSFSMKNNVAIYGGFPPTGTPTMANRRTSTNPTILSGDIGGSGTEDNSYHVLFNNNNGLTNSAILDGFVVTGGNATGSDPNNNGGGMLNIISSPQLRNCIFASNTATYGGALYNYNTSATPLLINCSFQFNSGVQAGGALFNNGSSPQLINSTFVGNTGVGGAVANLNSQPQLINCVLFNNGGSNSLVNQNSSVTARYSLFETSITGYDGTNNLTTSSSPFASAGSAVLNSCSPAINAGDPLSTTATSGATDVAGNTRFYNGGRIDMGAFEYQGAQSLPVAITVQPRASTTVPAGSTVTASVSVTGTVSAYQWYRNGSLVSEQTSATLTLSNVQASDAGRYVAVIVSPCNSVTSTAFTLVVNTVPDLTPIIFARPTSLTGPKSVSVVVEVNELNGIPTSGTITLRITRDPTLSLSLPASATKLNDHDVQNSVWQLNLEDGYYVLTTNQSIAGDGVLAVGLTGTLNPGGTTGILTISSVLVNIAGEIRRANNTDADKIEYFP